MNEIKEWSYALSVVIIFSSLVEAIAPNDNYRKYIHFVLGLILLIAVVNPVLKLMNVEYKPYMENGVSEYNIDLNKVEFEQKKYVLGVYEKMLISSVKSSVSKDLSISQEDMDVKLTIDDSDLCFGEIKAAMVVVTSDISEDNIEKIKNCVAYTLGVLSDSVTVVI